MDWSHISLVMIIMTLLAGCSRQDTEMPQTPTPFPSTGLTAKAPIGEPISISLANLTANPETFEGANLELSGQYSPLPKLICDSDPFPSPATWQISANGLVVNAAGQGQQLRQLLNEGQNITAIGRWLRFNGPVGCGKSAKEQEIWYLSLSRITDPHPLARANVQVDPMLEASTTIALLPEETPFPMDESPDLPQAATLEPAATAVEPPSSPSPFAPTITAVLSPSPTMTPSATLTTNPAVETSAATTTATADATGTVSATATLSTTPGTVTPTPETSATPEATATTTADVQNIKGDLDFEELVMSSLESGTVDRWDVQIDSSDVLTVTVAPATGANMAISIIGPDGEAIVDKQSLSPAGEVETISKLTLRDPGTYQIHISSNPASTTNYAIMVMDSSSYEFAFRGNLNSGEQRSDSISIDVDVFWFFNANDSDTISLEVIPTGATDAYVELYGPDSTRLLTLDEEIAGIPELLSDYSILKSGMYAVRVGEFDFEPMTYQIVVNIS